MINSTSSFHSGALIHCCLDSSSLRAIKIVFKDLKVPSKVQVCNSLTKFSTSFHSFKSSFLFTSNFSPCHKIHFIKQPFALVSSISLHNHPPTFSFLSLLISSAAFPYPTYSLCWSIKRQTPSTFRLPLPPRHGKRKAHCPLWWDLVRTGIQH